MANWNKLGKAGKVIDRRGATAGVGGLGVIGVIIYIGFSLLTGTEITPADLLGQIEKSQVQPQSIDASKFSGTDEYEQFASLVLGSNNELWSNIFSRNNLTYKEPTLVLFRNATQSSCGYASSQVGPHYCPGDSSIYLDETFFDQLVQRFGAKGGDVAEAYVISHEVGHHVQAQLGYLKPNASNEEQVRTELQADCFAGLWAHSIKNEGVFQKNEIVEALDAAAAVGDDRIQESVNGQVNPETWTHGSSEQRVDAFTRGYDTGDVANCTES